MPGSGYWMVSLRVQEKVYEMQGRDQKTSVEERAPGGGVGDVANTQQCLGSWVR